MDSFLYCWTDKKYNKLYVGTHKGSEDDSYVCSSKMMMEQYKQRKEDFSRKIIAKGSYDDIISLESAILKFENAAKCHLYYNMHNGDGNLYNKGHTNQTKEKLKKARAKRELKYWLGKKLPEAMKKKLSQSAKKAALTDNRGKRLAENRGKGVNYSLLMKEVWKKRRLGEIEMPKPRKRGT